MLISYYLVLCCSFQHINKYMLGVQNSGHTSLVEPVKPGVPISYEENSPEQPQTALHLFKQSCTR